MFGLGPATRIYLAAGVTDMRKGFEGLYGKGRFTWPQSGDAQGKVTLSHEELSLLLGGIDLTKTKHKRWYRKAPPEGHAAA